MDILVIGLTVVLVVVLIVPAAC